MPPPALGPGALTLGSVMADGMTFRPISDGEDVTLVEGAQGGFHVWMKFRAKDVPAGPTTMFRTARRMTDDKLVLRSQTDTMVGAAGPDGTWEVPTPLPMFMCPSPVGLSVIDQPIVFRIELQDSSGQTMAAQHIALVTHCPDSSLAFCMRICTG